MKRTGKGTRITLVLLIALLALALPIAQTASPVGAKNRARSVTRTFSNPAPINLPTTSNADRVAADLYPSAITVGGLKGTIRDVNVTLAGFTHDYPSDVEVLLVGPGGQTAVVVGNVGGAGDVTNVTLRLDDEAEEPLPIEPPETTPLQSGAYRPTNAPGNDDDFNAPAPSGNENEALSVFDGVRPNGTWRLFVQNEVGNSAPNRFAGGWELEIRT